MSPKTVIDSACATLLAIDPDASIYCENIPQSFARPCFFISAKLSEAPLMDERAMRSIDLSICRFPSPDEDPRSVAANAGELLSLAFEWLTIDERPRRATFMKHSVSDDDLSFKLDLCYEFHIIKHRDVSKMQKLCHTEKLH